MGFDQSKYIELPKWSDELRHLYWMIRFERRNVATRRRYYRKVEREKLRLAELGINQTKIAAVCRYLSNFKNAETLSRILAEIEAQMTIDFRTV